MYVAKDGSIHKKRISPCAWLQRFVQSFFGTTPKPEPFKTLPPSSCAPSG